MQLKEYLTRLLEESDEDLEDIDSKLENETDDTEANNSPDVENDEKQSDSDEVGETDDTDSSDVDSQLDDLDDSDSDEEKEEIDTEDRMEKYDSYRQFMNMRDYFYRLKEMLTKYRNDDGKLMEKLELFERAMNGYREFYQEMSDEDKDSNLKKLESMFETILKSIEKK